MQDGPRTSPEELAAVARALRGPRRRAEWPALAAASAAALDHVGHADGFVAGWAALAAEAHLLGAVDGEAHHRLLDAARARLPATPDGEALAWRLVLAGARAAVLRGDARRAAGFAAELATGAVGAEAEALVLRAALARLTGDDAAALAAARSAVEAPGAVGPLRAAALVQLGEAAALAGRWDEAEAALREAVASAGPCERTLGLALGALGELALRRGDARAALAWHEEAVERLSGVGDARLLAFYEVSRLGIRGALGEALPDDALVQLQAQAEAAGDAEVALRVALEQGLALQRAGDPHRARARLLTVQWRAQGAGLVALAAHAASAVAPEPVAVAADGAWFALPGQAAVSLERRGPMRRLLAALAAAEGRPVTVAALLAAGWPGERMAAESALARLYTAMRALRRLGLTEPLRTVEGGYRLVGCAVVRDSGAPTAGGAAGGAHAGG